jgi:hypothetical protein
MIRPDTMRSFNPQNKMRFIAAAALALLSIGAAHAVRQTRPAGCAFNLPLTASQCQRLLQSRRAPGRSWSSSRQDQTLIYTSQTFSSVVTISALTAQGLKPAGQLALPSGGFPLGLTVDASQNLYVAISPLGSVGVASVAVYTRGATKPSEVYTSGLTGPIDVAVDRYGTLYVANLTNPSGGGCGQGSGPGGSVVEYAKGSTTPTRTITDFLGCPNAVAVDSNANLYLTYIYYPSSGFAQSDVRKYPDKSIDGKALHLRVAGGADFGGVAAASPGDVIVQNVQDDATLNQVLTFAHHAKRPTSAIQYGGEGWGTGFKFFALLGNQLFAPAYVAQSFGYVVTTLAEFKYPSGREVFVQNPALTSLPFAYGVAVSPGKKSN